MIQIIRILSIVFQFKNGNFRYKIAYLRSDYTGYNQKVGDEIDAAIFTIFTNKHPQRIDWEYIDIFDSSKDLSMFLNTFTSKRIPLIISAQIPLNSMSILELDALKGKTFPDRHNLITLYYRANIDETHDYWNFLPTEIRIAINQEIYHQLAERILPL